jgi:integrase/recombinase XerC
MLALQATTGLRISLPVPVEWTLSETVELFLDAWTDSPNTTSGYRSRITAALEVLQTPDPQRHLPPVVTVGGITPAHLVRYRAAVMGRGWATSTKAGHIAAFRSFLRWCSATGLSSITTDELRLTLKLPAERGAKRRPAARAAAVALMYELVAPERKALIAFLFGAGVRASEAARLRVRHLDLRGGVADVLGKGDKWRAVPLADDLVEIMAAHLRREGIAHDPDAWVFAGRMYLDGVRRPATRHTIHTVVKLAARKAQVEHHFPHMFRHAYGRRTAKKKGVPKTQKWMGHEDIRTTQGYLDEDEVETEDRDDLPRLPFGP